MIKNDSPPSRGNATVTHVSRSRTPNLCPFTTAHLRHKPSVVATCVYPHELRSSLGSFLRHYLLMVNQQGTRIDTRPSSSGPIVPFAEADLTILTRSLLGYQLWTTAQVAHTSGVSTPTSMATTCHQRGFGRCQHLLALVFRLSWSNACVKGTDFKFSRRFDDLTTKHSSLTPPWSPPRQPRRSTSLLCIHQSVRVLPYYCSLLPTRPSSLSYLVIALPPTHDSIRLSPA